MTGTNARNCRLIARRNGERAQFGEVFPFYFQDIESIAGRPGCPPRNMIGSISSDTTENIAGWFFGLSIERSTAWRHRPQRHVVQKRHSYFFLIMAATMLRAQKICESANASRLSSP
jgi:hypothetical protein